METHDIIVDNNNNSYNNNITSLRNISIPNPCKGRKKIKGVFQDCKNNNSKWYIEAIDKTVCDECNEYYSNTIEDSSITYEEYMNVSFYIRFGEIIGQYFKLNPQLNKSTIINNIDTRNKFIFVDEKKISYGQKFGYGCGDGNPFLVVSFIGNTGSGKSCTVGSLCIESDSHPIPSYTNSESTSSDINLFIGEASIDNEKKRYIIFDSEGFGGTPPSVNKEEDSDSDSEDEGGVNNNEVSINNQEIEQYKKDWVQMGYPRLLYIISDILVYTHGGSNKEKSNIISRILNASEISSSNSNNIFKPHLIILITKNHSSDKFEDLVYAKEDFFKSCKKDDVEKLELLYQSISVIYLSSIKEKEGLLKYINNIKSLNKLIGDKLNASIKFKNENGFNFNKKANLNRIKKIINYLQRDPNSIPNLQLLNATGIKENLRSIQKIFDKRSFQDGANLNFSQQLYNNCVTNAICLYRYFEYIYSNYIIDGHSNRKSFIIAFGSLKLVLLKSYKKYQKKNNLNGDLIYEDYVFILNSVSKMISDKSPCEELINGKFECVNCKDSHPYHQSKEMQTKTNGLIKTIFGSPKTYQVPYITIGNYVSSLERFNLNSYLEGKVTSGQLSTVTDEGPILSLKNSIKNCESFCTSCISKKPTIHYSCGHILCVSCSKESKQGECIFEKCNGEILNKKELDFDPAIGCRILSIDGGGIKSVSQCIALQIMKEELYGINIYQLFDLIVGMGTGGFIALCLLTTKNDLYQIIELFTEFITLNSSASNEQISLDKYFEISNDLLKKELGDSPLKECYSKTRLVIPSFKVTENSNQEYVLINYDKVSNGIDCYDCNIPYNSAGSHSMISLFLSKIVGSNVTNCYHDNPGSIAIEEYISLWGHSCKNIDTFISLGSGVFTTKDMMDQLLTFDKESKSNILLEELNITYRSLLDSEINIFRVNGKFKNEDYWETITKLNNNLSEITSIYSNDKSLFNSINKSLSSLFYLSNLNYSNNQLSGNIKCRLKSIPIQIINQLNENYDKFYLQDTDESNSEFQITSKEIDSSNISISFIILNPSDIIDIRCSLVSKSGNINKTSISSCPFSINQDLKYFIRSSNNNN